MFTGLNCLAYDEAIIAQQDRIQQEIATSIPLVSDRQDLSILKQEYAEDDIIYQQKIRDLQKKYSFIRKTRPDGNCFYRAFGFSYLESLLDDNKELRRFKAIAAKSKLDLVSQGFTEFTIEDFHNTVCDKQPSVGELLSSFNEQSVSDLPSGVSVNFELLLEFLHVIVFSLLDQEVEPMSKESDHIHIIALAQALNVCILVEYMDRGEGGTVNHHIFPEDGDPKIFLLYRPGHYDILYK
uniref:ubiquitinyl hydrolase 1 n=1 Tax=Pygocentrus nattereri TaxID=42514 RepID=A0AAR2KBL1_PYGNA